MSLSSFLKSKVHLASHHLPSIHYDVHFKQWIKKCHSHISVCVCVCVCACVCACVCVYAGMQAYVVRVFMCLPACLPACLTRPSVCASMHGGWVCACMSDACIHAYLVVDVKLVYVCIHKILTTQFGPFDQGIEICTYIWHLKVKWIQKFHPLWYISRPSRQLTSWHKQLDFAAISFSPEFTKNILACITVIKGVNLYLNKEKIGANLEESEMSAWSRVQCTMVLLASMMVLLASMQA